MNRDRAAWICSCVCSQVSSSNWIFNIRIYPYKPFLFKFSLNELYFNRNIYSCTTVLVVSDKHVTDLGYIQ